MASTAAKWRFDLAAEAGSARGLADPPGFVDKVDETAATGAALVKQKAADTQIAVSRAWEFARSPLQQAFMMVMMMWMSGSGVQIFSIMITFTGLWQPLKAIMSSKQAFDPRRFGADPDVSMAPQRALFCAIQLGALCMALNKLDGMGLLPTHASDWMSQLPALKQTEFASAGIAL